MEYFISLAVSACATVLSGMALYFLKRYFKEKEKKDRAREELLAEETMLVLKSITAVGKLTLANTIALRDGKTNGETARALEEYERVDRELYEFLLSIGSHTCL